MFPLCPLGQLCVLDSLLSQFSSVTRLRLLTSGLRSLIDLVKDLMSIRADIKEGVETTQ